MYLNATANINSTTIWLTSKLYVELRCTIFNFLSFKGFDILIPFISYYGLKVKGGVAWSYIMEFCFFTKNRKPLEFKKLSSLRRYKCWHDGT
jgi:hypothetical protein